MVHAAIGLMFVLVGINTIVNIFPAFLLGVIYIAIGAYVIYKKKGELQN